MKKTLIYDCEIVSCIPPRYGQVNPSLKYCRGWSDFKGMGIACIGTWSSWRFPGQRYQVFTEDQLKDFQGLLNRAEVIVGFNSISFDDNLCRANGIKITTTLDLMREIRHLAGEPITGPCTPGYNLHNLASVNLGVGKTGTGELAPVLWQQGEYQKVLDYCLQDIKLTKRLYQLYLQDKLFDPVRHKPLNPYYTQHRVVESPIAQLLAYTQRYSSMKCEELS